MSAEASFLVPEYRVYEYEQLVDKVVFPERASVKTVVNTLSGSDVRTFEDVAGDMAVFDIRVASSSPIAG